MFRWQRLGLVGMDAVLLSAAYGAAFVLRLGWPRALEYRDTFLETLPVLLAVSIPVHAHNGLYANLLRYASIETARAALKSVVLSVLVSCLVFFLLFRLEGVPRSTFAIYGMTALLAVGGARMSVRVLRSTSTPATATRVALYGAGDTAELVLRGLAQKPALGYTVVALFDDDPRKTGGKMRGLPIRPGLGDGDTLALGTDVAELWVCAKDLPGEKLRAIYKTATASGVSVKLLPRLHGALLGEDIPRFEEPKIADLLRRTPRVLARERMRDWVRGRRILITGAGGSIGSELVRQVAELGCEGLALCDASEENLFRIEEELRSFDDPPATRPYLVDMRDGASVRRTFDAFRPHIVFHAAAYKHVPLVELNPCEGILNNVEGLLNAAQIAAEHAVEHFVFISTDKAVRPVSVMGATKRLGEIIVQALAKDHRTRYSAVRFGNVLGSSGSVIPTFQRQIRSGGPVTVTHRDMTRYFMLASEAAQLVIQAGTISAGGEVFILDMGEPVRIAEMAEDLIRLMGKQPGEDIEVRYTGVRPGEKISEELLIHADDSKTAFDDIWVEGAQPNMRSWESLQKALQRLLAESRRGSVESSLAWLQAMVPEFRPTHERTLMAIQRAPVVQREGAPPDSLTRRRDDRSPVARGGPLS